MIVPSMSETTTRSVCSHTKILAVAATAPVAEREKVIVLGPGCRLSAFYLMVSIGIEPTIEMTHQLVRG